MTLKAIICLALGASTAAAAKVTLTDTDFKEDLFFFCHIHNHMSGRIKQLDADGNVLQEEDAPELGYDHQEAPTGFDEECGTYGTGDFTEESGMCKAVHKSNLRCACPRAPTHW